MQLHGTLAVNLRYAVRSAERLQGNFVHGDTIQFWRELIAYARSNENDWPHHDRADVMALIAHLQVQLDARG